MKKIEAIIRKSKFEEVKESLHEVGIDWFSYWEVTGMGREKEGHVYRGTVYETNFIQRLVLSIIVRDINMEKTIDAIVKAAQTGEMGDGKIFVSNIEESIRIRNGERGPEALYLKE